MEIMPVFVCLVSFGLYISVQKDPYAVRISLFLWFFFSSCKSKTCLPTSDSYDKEPVVSTIPSRETVPCTLKEWRRADIVVTQLTGSQLVDNFANRKASFILSSFNSLKTLFALVHADLFWCFHNPPNSETDYRILNVRMWPFCTRIDTGDLGL